MLAERGSRAAGLGLGDAPRGGHLHLPDTSLDWMFDRLAESNRVEMRIIEDGFQRMHRHHRNVRAFEQLAPFGSGPAEEDPADLLVNFIDVLSSCGIDWQSAVA